MPCRYDPTPEEIRAPLVTKERLLKEKLDKLTRENDSMRELLIKAVGQYKGFEYFIETENPDLFKNLWDNQTKHRKEDLARLKKTFTKSKDYERLGRVILADPKKPLKEQLGFDPDEF